MLIEPTALQNKNEKTALSDETLNDLIKNIDKMDEGEMRALLDEVERLEHAKIREKSAKNFLFFAKQVWPDMLIGYHHRKMAAKFEEIASGRNKRIIINMPPRHGKSVLSSFLLPAWFLGLHPAKKIMQASHTGELAVDFGRKVRNLIADPKFQDIFSGVTLSADSKAAGRWSTSSGGEYFAAGVGANIAGKGADLFIIDDPHSEQDAKTGNPEVFDAAYEWYQTGPRQRLQPGASIVVVMTRWSKRDLTGRLVEKMAQSDGGDEWEVIELPMELPSGEPLWPEFWHKEDIKKLKETLDTRYWQSQYQQKPTSEEGALIKREWWQDWEDREPPPCEYIILSVDTAHEKNTRADYSAFTLWGVFYAAKDSNSMLRPCGREEKNATPYVILLDAFKDRYEFPELKGVALQTWKDWQPDSFIVEKKAAGAPLVQELRQMGIPVQEFSPSKGQDKIARVNAVTDMFRSGMVWAPKSRRWAQEVIEECAEFPAGSHDDYVDSASAALLRFRQGNFITLPSDYQDSLEDRYGLYRKAAYYG